MNYDFDQIEEVNTLRLVRLNDDGLHINPAVQMEGLDREIRGEDIREWPAIPPHYVDVEPPCEYPETEEFEKDHVGHTFHGYFEPGRDDPFYADKFGIDDIEDYEYNVESRWMIEEADEGLKLEIKVEVPNLEWTYEGVRTWCPDCGRKIEGQRGHFFGIDTEFSHHKIICRGE